MPKLYIKPIRLTVYCSRSTANRLLSMSDKHRRHGILRYSLVGSDNPQTERIGFLPDGYTISDFEDIDAIDVPYDVLDNWVRTEGDGDEDL